MPMAPFLFWLFVVGIFYVYAGFPLVLMLLAKIRLQQREHSSINPSVTLMVPAYNEDAVIKQKIENSIALDYPKDLLQILVAADGSDDRTVEIIKTYADQGIELSYNSERKGKMAAISRAMPKARGEIIIFSDANNIFTSNVIKALVSPFADPEVGCVSGAKTILRGDGLLGESEGLYWKYEAWIKKLETRFGCCTSVAGEVLAIRQELIEPCPDHIINDDFYMAMQVIKRGYRIIYAPKARSMERVSLSPQDEIDRRARIIAGRYQAMAMAYKFVPFSRPILLWQIISHKFLRPLVPFLMAGAIITNVLAVVWPSYSRNHPLFELAHPFNWIMLALQGLFYSLALTGNRIKHKQAIGRLLYLPTFLFNSNIAAIIGLWRYLSKRQTPVWKRAERRAIIDPFQDKNKFPK